MERKKVKFKGRKERGEKCVQREVGEVFVEREGGRKGGNGCGKGGREGVFVGREEGGNSLCRGEGKELRRRTFA